jgi:hypothetical protein
VLHHKNPLPVGAEDQRRCVQQYITITCAFLQAVRQDMCAINFCTCRFGFRGRDQLVLPDGSKCVVQIASLCMQLPSPRPELQDVAKIMQVVRLPLLPVLY